MRAVSREGIGSSDEIDFGHRPLGYNVLEGERETVHSPSSVLCRHKNSCYNLAQPIVRFGCWLSVIGSGLAEKVVQHRVMHTCIASADLLNVLESDI